MFTELFQTAIDQMTSAGFVRGWRIIKTDRDSVEFEHPTKRTCIIWDNAAGLRWSIVGIGGEIASGPTLTDAIGFARLLGITL